MSTIWTGSDVWLPPQSFIQAAPTQTSEQMKRAAYNATRSLVSGPRCRVKGKNSLSAFTLKSQTHVKAESHVHMTLAFLSRRQRLPAFTVSHSCCFVRQLSRVAYHELHRWFKPVFPPPSVSPCIWWGTKRWSRNLSQPTHERVFPVVNRRLSDSQMKSEWFAFDQAGGKHSKQVERFSCDLCSSGGSAGCHMCF